MDALPCLPGLANYILSRGYEIMYVIMYELFPGFPLLLLG
jgi:hypothetical protein